MHAVLLSRVAVWAPDLLMAPGFGFHLLNKLCGGGWKNFRVEIRSSASNPVKTVGIFFIDEKKVFC